MWMVRKLLVKKVISIPQGYLIYGNICEKIYKFLINGDVVLVEGEEGWHLLPQRTSRFVTSKFLQFTNLQLASGSGVLLKR